MQHRDALDRADGQVEVRHLVRVLTWRAPGQVCADRRACPRVAVRPASRWSPWHHKPRRTGRAVPVQCMVVTACTFYCARWHNHVLPVRGGGGGRPRRPSSLRVIRAGS
jgi:hypothetical protein